MCEFVMIELAVLITLVTLVQLSCSVGEALAHTSPLTLLEILAAQSPYTMRVRAPRSRPRSKMHSLGEAHLARKKNCDLDYR